MQPESARLINGEYLFRDLVDIDRLWRMLEKFNRSTGIVAGIVTNPHGEQLIAGRQNVCSMLQPDQSLPLGHCNDVVAELIASLEETRQTTIQQCRAGIMVGAAPIIVRGTLVASVIAGRIKPQIDLSAGVRNHTKPAASGSDATRSGSSSGGGVVDPEFREALNFLSELVVMMAEDGLREISLRNSKEELRTSQEKISVAMKMARAGHWEYDVASDTFTFNDNFYRIFRTSIDEIGSYNMSSAEYAKRFCHPDDIDLVANEVRAAIESDDPNYSRQIEHRVLFADGEIGYVTVRFFINKDSEGRTVRTYGVNQDITTRKTAEKALQENEERLRVILEKFPLGVAIIGTDRTIRWANREACRIAGKSNTEELRGRQCCDYLCSYQKDSCPISGQYRAFDNGERILHRGNGEEIVVLRTAIESELGGETILVETLVDITETKKLQDQQSRAERLEMAGTVAGQVAHDFNNLLGPLMAYPDLIREELPENHPAIELLDQIEVAAERISEINQDLLAMGRRGHFTKNVLCLNDIVNRALGDLNSLLADREVETDLYTNLNFVLGNSAQLGRMINNLLNNAIDAVQTAGTISVRTENCYMRDASVLSGRIPDGEYVRLTVEDTGSGIPEEFTRQIFDPFFTTKTADKKRGSGLGMSIVQAVIEDHGGFIDLKSELGKGTAFYVYLPITGAPKERKEDDKSPDGCETILIVDDDKVQREVATRLLRKLGYNVESVECGEDAVELLRDHPRDLVILDMVMPDGIDGTETYRRIAEFSPTQKAIIVSGFAESDRVTDALKMGVGAFVKKPVTKSVIAAAVRAELDRDITKGEVERPA